MATVQCQTTETDRRTFDAGLAAMELLHMAVALQQMLPQLCHSIVVAACCHATSYGIGRSLQQVLLAASDCIK